MSEFKQYAPVSDEQLGFLLILLVAQVVKHAKLHVKIKIV